MPLPSGTRLGAYQIVAPIGAGGMGEVCRAHDPRLSRDVAIKVLPEAFVASPERLARFRREAQTLASLNHPNIAAIYGLEELDGAPCLVLELVAGETLAARLARGALSVLEALALGVQIAAAVLAASGRHPWALGVLAWTYAKAGQGERARAVYDEMEARARHEFMSPFWLATAAAAAGLPERTLHQVERTVAEHDPLLGWGRASPFWDGVTTHPQFEELVRGVWA